MTNMLFATARDEWRPGTAVFCLLGPSYRAGLASNQGVKALDLKDKVRCGLSSR